MFQDRWVMLAIGLAGGAMLLYMGGCMVARRARPIEEGQQMPYHPFLVGIITTAANPYFFLWWATVGLLLITGASRFGAWAVVLFAVLHWSCDLGWDYLVGYLAHRSRHMWSQRTQAWVLGGCGLLLLAFGIYFIVSPMLG